jgi:hypothetical protein
MKQETLFRDRDDEVNIAQFFPVPGHGLLYGTKRGKIRTFLRESESKNRSNNNSNEQEEMIVVEPNMG